MRWFALILLLANAALWFYGDSSVPDRVAVVLEKQVLPRVADLRTDTVERQDERLPEQSPALGEVELVAEPSEPERYCVHLGWFDSADEARAAYQSLGRPGVDYVVREEERELAPLHWVIIPPQPDDRALELFQDLQRRGIDSYLVRSGENKNAISLGLFESREAAEAVLDEKKRQNLNAVLANFPRNQISYALVFEDELGPDSGSVEAAESDYAGDFELVEIRRCEGVATARENP